MTIQTFIESAIEGGWKFRQGTFIKNPKAVERQGNRLLLIGEPTADGWESKEYLYFSDINIDKMWLDPLAWKAVGTVEGWKSLEDPDWQTNGWDNVDPEWTVQMHDMVEALIQGKTITQYLETL